MTTIFLGTKPLPKVDVEETGAKVNAAQIKAVAVVEQSMMEDGRVKGLEKDAGKPQWMLHWSWSL